MENNLKVCDPHGLQPPRLFPPWDFPGKSTGMGCHFLLQGIFPTQGLNPGLPHCRKILYRLSHQGSPIISLKVKVKVDSRSVVSDFLQPHCPYSPWNCPGQKTGVGSLSLLQGVFPTQRSNPGFPHCRRIFYQLNHKGSCKKSIIYKNIKSLHCTSETNITL